MPTYDYECKTCGHRFEAFQSFNDEPLKSCPECGKRVRRLIGGGVGIIFKGSGFYVTDSKRSGNGGAKKSAASETAAASSGGKDGTKVESKTDAKTESKSEGKKEEGKKSGDSKGPEKVAV